MAGAVLTSYRDLLFYSQTYTLLKVGSNYLPQFAGEQQGSSGVNDLPKFYDLNFGVPPPPKIRMLQSQLPKTVVLGGGPLGGALVMRGGTLQNRMSALM